MHAIFYAVLFAAALAPAKTWFAPTQPLTVNVKAEGDSTLILTDFTGRVIEPKAPADVSGEKGVDLRTLYPQQLETPGTYLLYETKKGGTAADFVGTPLVIGVRQDNRRGAPPGPMVVKVEPLRYAVMTTDQGPATLAFYYDVAPNTAASFLSLAEQGYFNGLTFHRIVPDFVIQGGDPRGDGTGGPGYTITAEFSERPHAEGTLSMARNGDPSEGPGVLPRPEFANSAGSQFFVCLNYQNTQQLDRKYTVFGKVVGDGMKAIRAIAALPLADERSGRPQKPAVIQTIEVKPVTRENNPYAELLKPQEAPAPPAQPGQPVTPGEAK